jgi:hypothetical protein
MVVADQWAEATNFLSLIQKSRSRGFFDLKGNAPAVGGPSSRRFASLLEVPVGACDPAERSDARLAHTT